MSEPNADRSRVEQGYRLLGKLDAHIDLQETVRRRGEEALASIEREIEAARHGLFKTKVQCYNLARDLVASHGAERAADMLRQAVAEGATPGAVAGMFVPMVEAIGRGMPLGEFLESSEIDAAFERANRDDGRVEE